MDQHPTWLGRTLGGRYRIDAMLGQGGMSAVYRATDPNLKRVVAIKLIHPHLSTDPLFVQRFESEAAAVASLRHPNIVQVYDFDNDHGVYYMVLEFIPGETLQDRLKRLAEAGRQLSIEEAQRYSAHIAEAAGYAHQRGMVHRDIKPANIMLDVHGQAILMDFGIVKILGGDSHTSTGAVVGTARYMSPELIRGEVADHRSDIYSLGVTLYEMLSGRPPFVADSAMTLMMMHLNDPVPDVRGFRPDAPVDLIRILERCLAKDRSQRYPSAADLVSDLKRLQQTAARPPEPEPDLTIASRLDARPASSRETESRPVPVPPPTPIASRPAGTSLPGRRSLWLAGAGLAVIACLAGGIVLASSLLRGQGSSPPEPTRTLPAATDIGVPSVEPVAIVLATETLSPTGLPTQTASPTLSQTPEGPYVVITGIRVEGASYLYIVDYEVHNLDDTMHVHMFFNTVPPEQAGSPASGPWKLTWNQYGDPPFTQYGIANRPEGATQMCALVARANHSVLLGTGNCVDLPE